MAVAAGLSTRAGFDYCQLFLENPKHFSSHVLLQRSEVYFFYW